MLQLDASALVSANLRTAPTGTCRSLVQRFRVSAVGRTDDRNRGIAITRLGRIARVLAVETDRPGTVTVAAGRCDYGRAVDDARGLQSGVERDPQLALSRSRKRHKGEVAAEIDRIANA